MKKKSPATGLLYAMRLQIKKDLTVERVNMFRVYVARWPLVESIYYAFDHNLTNRIKARFAFLYGMISGAKFFITEKNVPLAVYLHTNEEKRIRSLQSVLDSLDFRVLDWRRGLGSRFFSFLYFLGFFIWHLDKVGQILRVLEMCLRGKPLFVGMRQAEVLFNYIYFSARFKSNAPAMLLVSTEGNPHGCALMGAARRQKVPLVYASHGVVSSHPVQIDCDLGLFYGQKSLDHYVEQDSYFKQTQFYGFRESFKPIKGRSFEKIMICLSQYPNVFSLRAFLHSYVRTSSQEIILREHPQMRGRLKESLREYSHQIRFSYEPDLAHVLTEHTLVVAGNSTVHLEALLAGAPTVYAPSLDLRGADPLPFIQDSLVYTLPNLENLAEHITKIDAHYSNPLWRRHFDGYFHLEESFAQSLTRLESAFRGILPQ